MARFLFLLAFLGAFTTLAPVAAARAPVVPEPQMPAQQAADEKTVKAVLQVATDHGLAAMKDHLPELRAVLDHAPKSFPAIEVHGPVIILRVDRPDVAKVLLAAVAGSRGHAQSAVFEQYNTYPTAAFLLASYSNEMRRPAEAVAYADRGLAMQPQNSMLISEKAVALYASGRAWDALAMLDNWLASNSEDTGLDRARLLRSKGYGLVEIGDLAGAREAYEGSLEIEPDHAGAKTELTYIAKRQAGDPNVSTVTTIYDGMKLYGDAKSGARPAADQKP
jgi:tetratricopeptide (TPR) repeat protein